MLLLILMVLVQQPTQLVIDSTPLRLRFWWSLTTHCRPQLSRSKSAQTVFMYWSWLELVPVISYKLCSDIRNDLCFYQPRHLRLMRRFLHGDSSCNWSLHLLLADLIAAMLCSLATFQHVQNAATRLILGLSSCEYVSSALMEIELLWLPTVYWMNSWSPHF